MDGLQPQLGEVAPEGALRTHRELNGLADGERIDCYYVVRDRSRRPTKKGGEWLALKLSDRSGNISAKCWDEIEARFAAAQPGTIVRVVGRYECSSQWGNSLIIDTITAAREGDYDPADLLETSPVPLSGWSPTSAHCSKRSRAPTCARSSTVLLAACEIWPRFRDAPAAKRYHQAYRHGLLEHTLSVAQGVSAAASFFPGIDRDVAITGALLHDIGKLEAYNDDPLAIDLTDLGRLIGEIPLGYYRVRREIESIEGFDPTSAGRSCTSCSATTGRSSTARRSCPQPARRPRPHDGQPRRQARQLRPDRARPRRGPGLVRLRPRHRRHRLLPRPRDGLSGRCP